MSQRKVFFLLTLILGLCYIIECNSDVQDASARNSPRRGKKCTNCYHYIVFGKYTEGDKLVLDKDYSKLKNDSYPVKAEVVFESPNNKEITYIYVEDSKQSERIYEDDLQIIEGGIGHTRVKMIIKSNYTEPTEYGVVIWAK